ncbi:MAG: hypothetical protein ACFB9M_03620 [Myxococcota bacterium]
MRKPIHTAVLLGTQRFDTTLERAVSEVHDQGPIAAVTCGWREREEEDEALRQHLGVELINLHLRRRKQEVFRRDKELAQAHQHRQQVLRHKQEFYLIRLQYTLAAHRIIRGRSAPAEVRKAEEAASLAALQRLDQYHLEDCRQFLQQFDEEVGLAEHPEVRRHREEIQEILSRCRSIAIAGGHVAAIANRLSFFGLPEAMDGHNLFAWSGGAMAITDRIVLYHDHPPQGPGAAEVLSPGMGWVPDIVVLPEPEKRLRKDGERVSILASRFLPARSLAFPSGTHLTWRDGQIISASGVWLLGPEGEIGELKTT